MNHIAYSTITGTAQFEVSQTGTLVYASGSPQNASVSVQWLESDGKMQPLFAKPGDYGRPSLSPGGQRLAIEVRDGPDEDVWVYDLGRDRMTRVTFDGKVNQNPVWSPDARYVVFDVRRAWAGRAPMVPASLRP